MPKNTKHKDLNVYLREHKEINYSLMLLSDAESEHNAVVKKPKNMRLKPDGPSVMRQKANKLVEKAKPFHTKTPSHSYPIRRCANATEAAKGRVMHNLWEQHLKT